MIWFAHGALQQQLWVANPHLLNYIASFSSIAAMYHT